ncbi:Hypothetical protein LUCI_4785 [Lucifera butyrica]|uniref:Uncharacterized protein n=1 Tax=Lucifera butyrica TaxID=1351585 RepID=A0A498RFA3_9FIRM|nr:Hypothetical protein LUCI_4785 [Lucifera butyrica]
MSFAACGYGPGCNGVRWILIIIAILVLFYPFFDSNSFCI